MLFYLGLPTEDNIETDRNKRPILCIIDDLMIEGMSSKGLLKFYIDYSHHKNISIILTSQSMFPPGSSQYFKQATEKVIFQDKSDSVQEGDQYIYKRLELFFG